MKNIQTYFFVAVILVLLGMSGCAEFGADSSRHPASTMPKFIRNSFQFYGSGTLPDSLAPLYPNPYNRNAGDSNVTIFFTLSDTGTVKIIIQNPLGDSVAIWRDSLLLPGSYIGTWNPITTEGVRLRSGLYFVTMRAAPDVAERNYIDSRVLDIQSND
ncbi:MAG: hypothetical protein WCH46_00905 [bacterium]